MPLPRDRTLQGLVVPPCRMMRPGVQVSLPFLQVRLALLHPPRIRNWTTACRRLLLEPRVPNEARLAPRLRPLELSSSTCHRLRIREVPGNGGTGERMRQLQLVQWPCHCEPPGMAWASPSHTRAACRFQEDVAPVRCYQGAFCDFFYFAVRAAVLRSLAAWHGGEANLCRSRKASLCGCKASLCG